MASYAIANIKELEDVAPKFGLPPGVQARFAREQLGCEKTGLSHQRLAADTRMPFGHRHGQQEELYVILSGSGRIKLDDEIAELGAWDVVRVAPDTMRALEAGPDGLEYLAFGGPTAEASDGEIVQGWWAE
jgi:mannose-6-phosphate isomerase-like protein (cupin superfamily)